MVILQISVPLRDTSNWYGAYIYDTAKTAVGLPANLWPVS